MWVGTIIDGRPSVEVFQVLPPSTDATTPPGPPPQRFSIRCRGRSCLADITAHILPFTAGSNSTQYVVFSQALGTPVEAVVALSQLSPPSSLRIKPMSV